MHDDYDSPWKEMLEQYFEQFMALLFPEAHAEIDWSRGWQSLDQELQKLTRDADLGRRLADKLVRVWRRDGEPWIVLVHVEVQGEPEVAFPERIYIYNYRAYDRYRLPVVSLAVLGDDHPSWRPGGFGWEIWGCHLRLDFPVVKLWDYNERWEDLESSANPFALLVMAHLKTRATRHDPERRYRWKLRLVRWLFERGYEREDVVQLFNFLDWLLYTPQEELQQRFRDDVEQLQEELHVPYVNTIERAGIQKGRELGIEEGIQRGETTLLRRLLARRFGSLPAWVEERLGGASREDLESWADRVLDASTLDEVFA